MKNKRMKYIAVGGKFKDIHKQLNLDDAENGGLINTDNEEIRDDVEDKIERYQWNIDFLNYTKIKE